jgi:hypothetical protein
MSGLNDKALKKINAIITLRFHHFLQEKSPNTKKWYEDSNIIILSVTSNGMTGQQWIDHFEKKEMIVTDIAKGVLQSPKFKPSRGITKKIAILKGCLWSNMDRITVNIDFFANECNLGLLKAEDACLVRDIMTDKKIETMRKINRIAIMHNPIEYKNDKHNLLITTSNFNSPHFTTDYSMFNRTWFTETGFAYRLF